MGGVSCCREQNRKQQNVKEKTEVRVLQKQFFCGSLITYAVLPQLYSGPGVVSNYPVEDGDDSPARRGAEIKDNTEREERVRQSNEGASGGGGGGRAVEAAAVRDTLTKATMCKLNAN